MQSLILVRLDKGKHDTKRCSLRRRAFYLYKAAMFLCNALDHGQTESPSLLILSARLRDAQVGPKYEALRF